MLLEEYCGLSVRAATIVPCFEDTYQTQHRCHLFIFDAAAASFTTRSTRKKAGREAEKGKKMERGRKEKEMLFRRTAVGTVVIVKKDSLSGSLLSAFYESLRWPEKVNFLVVHCPLL